MATRLDPARRLATRELNQPGDYCSGFNGTKPVVFFVLPQAREVGVHPALRSQQMVTVPSHREQPDGSLQVLARIQIFWRDSSTVPVWQGFLDAGNVWRQT